MEELTAIVKQESKNRLYLTEKIGISLLKIASLGALTYAARFINDKFLNNTIDLPKIVENMSYHSGDFAHITMPYLVSGVIEGTKSRKYSNIILGLTTTYHTIGEIMHSSIAPNLPQILPGTPDPKDIPIMLVCATGLYLTNKHRVLVPKFK